MCNPVECVGLGVQTTATIRPCACFFVSGVGALFFEARAGAMQSCGKHAAGQELLACWHCACHVSGGLGPAPGLHCEMLRFNARVQLSTPCACLADRCTQRQEKGGPASVGRRLQDVSVCVCCRPYSRLLQETSVCCCQLDRRDWLEAVLNKHGSGCELSNLAGEAHHPLVRHGTLKVGALLLREGGCEAFETGRVLFMRQGETGRCVRQVNTEGDPL